MSMSTSEPSQDPYCFLGELQGKQGVKKKWRKQKLFQKHSEGDSCLFVYNIYLLIIYIHIYIYTCFC